MRRLHHILLWTLAALSLGAESLAAPPADASRVDRVKAAYVLNFIKFSTWPEEAFSDADGRRAPIVVLVLGDDDGGVGDLLAAMVAGKPVDARQVEVRRRPLPRDAGAPGADAGDFWTELAGAHVLYIAQPLRREVPALLARAGAGTLTVGDTPGFARTGGMLGLVPEGGRIVFEANPDVINRSGVRLSSKVLRLARIVQSKEGS